MKKLKLMVNFMGDIRNAISFFSDDKNIVLTVWYMNIDRKRHNTKHQRDTSICQWQSSWSRRVSYDYKHIYRNGHVSMCRSHVRTCQWVILCQAVSIIQWWYDDTSRDMWRATWPFVFICHVSYTSNVCNLFQPTLTSTLCISHWCHTNHWNTGRLQKRSTFQSAIFSSIL